jgi:hypothetical protein
VLMKIFQSKKYQFRTSNNQYLSDLHRHVILLGYSNLGGFDELGMWIKRGGKV